MGAEIKKIIEDILKVDGNEICADCGANDPLWGSINLGILLCQNCAGVHRSLSNDISRIRSLQLDRWNEKQIFAIQAVGNKQANAEYLACLPPFYRLPGPDGPECLRQQFILDKYTLGAFRKDGPGSLLTPQNKQGYLVKRMKDRDRFRKRLFRLTATENSLAYFKPGENSEPATPLKSLRLDRLNASFLRDKSGANSSVQEFLMLNYDADVGERVRFVYLRGSAKDLVDWYQSIRGAKFHLRCLNSVGMGEPTDSSKLAANLTTDPMLIGWLQKTGSQGWENWQRRWCMLLCRRLHYFSEEYGAEPRGHVILGEVERGYWAELGTPAQLKVQTPANTYPFYIRTPSRDFVFLSDLARQADDWVESINKILRTPMTQREMVELGLEGVGAVARKARTGSEQTRDIQQRFS